MSRLLTTLALLATLPFLFNFFTPIFIALGASAFAMVLLLGVVAIYMAGVGAATRGSDDWLDECEE